MNTLTQPLTRRRQIVDTPWYRIRCMLRLHPWGAWERVEFVTTSAKGRTVSQNSFWLQVSECTCCTLARTRPL